MVFYPWGCDLRYHTLSLVNGLFAAPVTFLFGPNTALNALFVTWTFLTGVFAALWARHFGLGIAASFFVGIIAALNPFRWTHQQHLNLFSTPWLFLSFLLCEKLMSRRGKALDIVLFSASWLLALYTDWYFGVFTAIYFCFRLIFFLKNEVQTERLRYFLKMGLMPSAIIAVSLKAYFYATYDPVYTSLGEIPVDKVDIKFSAYWSLDLLHLVLPIWLIPLIEVPIRNYGEFRMHPGAVFLLLAGCSFFARRYLPMSETNYRFLFCLAVIFLILSLGPILQIAGCPASILGVPVFLPAGIIEFVPALTSIRVFARFSFAGFILLVLIGAAWLEGWIKSKFSANWIAPAFLAVLYTFLLEIQWQFPVMYLLSERDKMYKKANKPVLEIPFTPSSLSGLHLYHQTIHHKPIFVAEFSRLAYYKKRYLEAFPALDLLNKVALGKPYTEDDKRFIKTRFREELRRLGPLHIIVGGISFDSEKTKKVRAELRRLSEFYTGEWGEIQMHEINSFKTDVNDKKK